MRDADEAKARFEPTVEVNPVSEIDDDEEEKKSSCHSHDHLNLDGEVENGDNDVEMSIFYNYKEIIASRKLQNLNLF